MFSNFRPKSEFIRNVLTLMTGTTIAQVIPLAVTPILTRIYSPQDFGLFALYISIISIVGVVATGRYELAIMLPKKDEDALNIVYLSLIIASLFSLITFIVVWLFNIELTKLLANTLISSWLYLVPISVLFVGINQTLNYWHNRNKLYHYLGSSRVIQSSSASSIQYLGGINVLAKHGGLIIGYVIGQVAAIIYLSINFLKSHKRTSINRVNLIKQLVQYKDYPIKNALGAFIDTLANWMPIFLLGFLYSPSSAGLYLIAMRVVNIPMIFIGSSFGQVFYRKGTELSKIGSLYPFVIKTTITLTMIISIPMGILMIWGQDLFIFAFNKNWSDAGIFSRLLAPLMIVEFVSSSQSTMMMITNKLSYQLCFFSLLLIIQTFAFIAGYYYFKSYFISITMFSVSGIMLYGYNVYWILKNSKIIDTSYLSLQGREKFI